MKQEIKIGSLVKTNWRMSLFSDKKEFIKFNSDKNFYGKIGIVVKTNLEYSFEFKQPCCLIFFLNCFGLFYDNELSLIKKRRKSKCPKKTTQ